MGVSTEGFKIVLMRHPINNGGEYTGTGNYGSDRKCGTNIEIVEASSDMATELLLDNLKKEVFTSVYREKFRSTPVISRNQSSKTE